MGKTLNTTWRRLLEPSGIVGWDGSVVNRVAARIALSCQCFIIVALATQLCSAGVEPAPASPPLELAGHSAGVRWLAFAPDGKSLASAGDDGNLKIWDLSTGQVKTTIGNLQQGARIVAYAPDGRQLACTDGHNDVHVYDVASGRQIQHHAEDLGGIPMDMRYVNRGATLANLDAHSGLQLWLYNTAGQGPARHRTVMTYFQWHGQKSAVLSPDGKTVAAAPTDNPRIHIFDLAAGQERPSLPNTGGALCLAISPDSRLLAAPGNFGVTYLFDLASGREIKQLQNYAQPQPMGQPDQISDVAFSPDGKLLIAGGVKLLVVWDVTTGRQRLTTQPTALENVFSVAISPDDKSLAYGTSMGPVIVQPLPAAGSAAAGNPPAPALQSITASNQSIGSQVISNSPLKIRQYQSEASTPPVQLWPAGQQTSGVVEEPPVPQLGEQTPPGRLQTGNALIQYVIFSPDGHTLAADSGMGVDLFDNTGRKLASLDLAHGMLIGMSFTADSKRLITVNSYDVAQTWDATTGKQLAGFTMQHPAPAPPFGVAAVARDGRTVALVGMRIENMTSVSSVVEIWDITNGRHRTLSQGDFRAAAQMMAFAPDGKLLAVAQQTGPAQIWNLTTNQQIATLPLDQQSTLCNLVFSPDSKTLATESYDGKILVWDAHTGKQLAGNKAGNAGPHRLAFTPDGKFLAILHVNQVRLWDYANNHEIVGTSGLAAQQSFSFLAVSPAGNEVALGMYGGGVALKPLASGATAAAVQPAPVGGGAPAAGTKAPRAVPAANVPAPPELFMIKAHDQTILDMAFSPDSKTLATAGMDNSIKTWNIPSGKPGLTLGQQWVGWVAFSPNGKLIASATYENAQSTRLWDAATGRPVSQFQAFGPVAFSPDGRTLATGGRNGLTLWDLQTGQPRLQIRGQVGAPLMSGPSLIFSSDGRVLAWLDNNLGGVRLTDTSTGANLATITGQAGIGDNANSIARFAFAAGRIIGYREQASANSAPRGLVAYNMRGQELGMLPLDLAQYSVTSLTFAPGGRVLAVAVAFTPPPSAGNAPFIQNTASHEEVWLCDATTGRKLAALSNFPIESGAVVAFSPDGHYLAVGAGGVFHVYDVSGILRGGGSK